MLGYVKKCFICKLIYMFCFMNKLESYEHGT